MNRQCHVYLMFNKNPKDDSDTVSDGFNVFFFLNSVDFSLQHMRNQVGLLSLRRAPRAVSSLKRNLAVQMSVKNKNHKSAAV